MSTPLDSTARARRAYVLALSRLRGIDRTDPDWIGRQKMIAVLVTTLNDVGMERSVVAAQRAAWVKELLLDAATYVDTIVASQAETLRRAGEITAAMSPEKRARSILGQPSYPRGEVMANWLPEQVMQSCGHSETVNIPHPSFEGEQIYPEKWREQIATVPCYECYKREQEQLHAST